MPTEELILHSPFNRHFALSEFVEAFYHSKRQYTTNHLAIWGEVSNENLFEALEKALNICQMAGNNYKQHFQKIYVYEAENEAIRVDYRMSKSAFNLLVMQLTQLNENRAKWLWKLAEI